MRRNRIIIIVVVIIICSIGYYLYKRNQESKEADNAYRTVKVEKGDLEVVITSTGIVKASTQIDIKSEIGGKVILLPYEEGERVSGGDVIAVIDNQQQKQSYIQADADYTNSLAQLQQAELNWNLQKVTSNISIATQQEKLARAKLSYDQAITELQEQKELALSQISQSKSRLKTAEKQFAQITAGSRKQEISEKLQSLNQAEATMENSRREYERQKELYEKDFVPRKDLDNAEKDFIVSKAQYASAKEAYNMALEGNRIEDIAIVKSQLEEAKKNLQFQITQSEQNIASKERAVEMAINDYHQAHLALEQEMANSIQVDLKGKTVMGSKALLGKANASKKQYLDQLTKTKIVSPTDGIIINRAVDIGDVVASQTMSSATGTTLMTIANLKEIYAEADIDESDIGKIKTNLDVTVTAPAYHNLKIPGIVTHIAPQAIQVEQIPTFKVKIKILIDKIPDKDIPQDKKRYELLYPGMSVDSDIHVLKKTGVLKIPIEAIWEKDGKNYVTLVKGNNQFDDIEVVPGIKNNIMWEIVKGVKEGDEIKVPEIKGDVENSGNGPPHRHGD